jgi:ABC-2 type transport system permease protein
MSNLMQTSDQDGRLAGRLRIIWENPITIKELRSRMRGRRAFVVLTVYLFILSGLISLIYTAYATSSNSPYGPDPRNLGKVIFSTIVGVQLFIVIFVGPAFTAGAITGEKERQTYEMLRTTLLTARWFVAGKLISALSYVFLLIFAAIPLQSIAFLLGGVAFSELIISQILLIVGAIAFAMYGLYCSSSYRSTLSASVVTFAGALFITVGVPLLVGLFSLVLSPVFATATTLSWIAEIFVMYLLLFLAATNLPATMIVSEIFLLEEGALFYFMNTMSGRTVFTPSPWPFAIMIYGLIGLLFFWLTVRKIRKIANK